MNEQQQELNERIADDEPYEAFRRSCINVMAAWRDLAPTP